MPAQGIQVCDESGDAALAEVTDPQQAVVQTKNTAAFVEVVGDRPYGGVSLPELRREWVGGSAEHVGEVEATVGEGHLRIDHPAPVDGVAGPEITVCEGRPWVVGQHGEDRAVARSVQASAQVVRHGRVVQVGADASFGEEGRPMGA